jgi:hypothetical protein
MLTSMTAAAGLAFLLAAAPGFPGEAAGCQLYQPSGQRAASQECLKCHNGSVATAHLGTSHPVDMVFAASQSKPGSWLRPEAEVVKRGGFGRRSGQPRHLRPGRPPAGHAARAGLGGEPEAALPRLPRAGLSRDAARPQGEGALLAM